jgi:hypothetical protein
VLPAGTAPDFVPTAIPERRATLRPECGFDLLALLRLRPQRYAPVGTVAAIRLVELVGVVGAADRGTGGAVGGPVNGAGDGPACAADPVGEGAERAVRGP